MSLIIGIILGATLAVAVPTIFTFVSAQLTKVKAKLAK